MGLVDNNDMETMMAGMFSRGPGGAAPGAAPGKAPAGKPAPKGAGGPEVLAEACLEASRITTKP
jgi:hypothetical protein